MKKLREIITESFANDRIHKNPTIPQLYNIAKTSKNGHVRFIVHKDKIVAGGDGDNFIHYDMIPVEHKSPLDRKMYNVDVDGDDSSYPHLRGNLFDTEYGGFHITLSKYNKNTGWTGISKHPILDNFNKKITEGMFSDVVHQNPSIEKLKHIAKNSEYGMARFIVHNGKITAGADGYEKIHYEMLPPEALAAPHDHSDSYIAKYPHQRGILDHVGNDRYEVRVRDYVHNNTVGNTSGWRVSKHPVLDDFKKRGCTVFVPKSGSVNAIAEAYSLVYHKTLNNKLFDGNTLDEDVRRALLRIGESFAKFSSIPDEAIKDIIFTGGNCNYNYSKFSDCDVHVVYDELMLGKGIYKAFLNDYFIDKKALWALTHDIKVKGYPVELYAQAYGDHLAASGVYSLMRAQWLTMPVHDNYKFKRDPVLNKKIDDLKKTIDSMIESDVNEDEFRLMREKLKNMRSAALASGNEFAFDNLVFKGLRNSGVLNRMNEHLRARRDRDLSL